MANYLTVDFEYDWGGRQKSIYAIEKYLPIVLDELDKHNSVSTFFISTETLNETRDFVIEIKKRGHEIASHGHDHLINYGQLTNSELNTQIKRSKELLEDLIGEPVLGFRTPQFRKNRFTEEVLTQLGFSYDSSEVTVNLPGRYQSNQFANQKLPQFQVCNFLGKFPGGLKWYNLLLNSPASQSDQVIYFHLFDLLSATETLGKFGQEIKYSTLVFYMMRWSPILNSLQKLSVGSRPLMERL